MFRKILLSVLLAAATGAATADDYTYIAGGGQMSFIIPTGADDEQNTKMDIQPGFYLHGGYGFDNKLFLDLRLNYMGMPWANLREDMLGVGYHHVLSDSTDFYALAGISRYSSYFDYYIKFRQSFISATGETGLKIKLTPDISVSSALRLANYDGEAYYEARLGAAYALTPHVSIEAGYQFHKWRISPCLQMGTLGVRYTF